MPAIQIARLKIQAAHLAGSFDRPQAFISGLNAVLNFYADRTFRPGQWGSPPPLLHAYNVPKPVLRQILAELVPLARQSPPQALELCDLLWKQDILESRSLAISVLAALPLDASEEVIVRASRWLIDETDESLTDQIFEEGLGQIKREAPERYEILVESWLVSRDPREQKLGLKALSKLIEAEDYHNFPFIFRVLTPFVRVASPRLRASITATVRALVLRSPGEAAYFLRQNLNIPESADTPWLIRQVIRDFPEGLREPLRQAIKKEA